MHSVSPCACMCSTYLLGKINGSIVSTLRGYDHNLNKTMTIKY